MNVSIEMSDASRVVAQRVDVTHPSTVSPARVVVSCALTSPATRCEPGYALRAVMRRTDGGGEPARRRKHNTLVMFSEGQARGLRSSAARSF
jgi:hypothetical protein